MTTINTSERAITRARHQRRPRPPGGSYAVIEQWLPASIGSPGDNFHEPVPAHSPLPDTRHYPGPADTVDFFFWSVTDLSNGSAEGYDRQNFNFWLSSRPMTAAAWYGPPSGPNGNGPPDIMIDAFSVVTGGFIDEDFVTVTSDPSLTDQANQDGWVPTTSAESLQAYPSIGATLAFDHWEVLDAGTPARADPSVLSVPARSGGMAVAIYVSNGLIVNPPSGYGLPPQFWTMGDPALILQALLSQHEGPFAPLIQRLATNDAIRGLAGGLSQEAVAGIGKLLDQDATAALNEAQAPTKADSTRTRKKQK